MSPMALAREAFRPQVVKTGEQKRIEREQQARKADFLIAQVEDIQKEQPELSQKEAILEFAQQVEDQSFDLLVQQGMKEKLTPEYVRQYKMRDPISATQNLFTFGPEVQDQIIRDMARQNVKQRFREAGLEAELSGSKFDVAVGSIGMYDDLQYNVGKMWKAVTEDPTGNLHVQMLKDAGRIDPDAIVESTPVQYARNANFAFRMVFNPMMDTMENTANAIDYAITGDTTPAMRRGQDEVGFAERTGQKLAAPTYDFAGDKEYVEKYGLTSAWLSEALLETATGRTLGNDIVSWHPEIYYTMAESPENAYKGLQFTPDSYVIAGTIFEMGIPVEAPLQIAALGVKGAAKIPSGVRQAHKISKELGSAATPLQAAKQAPGKVSTSDVVTSIVQNSKVTQHVAEDASDIILAAERVEDLGPRLQGVGDKDAAVSMIADDLGPRGQVTARKLLDEPDPSLAAKEAIDDLVGKGDEVPALSAAAQDSVKLRGG